MDIVHIAFGPAVRNDAFPQLLLAPSTGAWSREALECESNMQRYGSCCRCGMHGGAEPVSN